MRTHRWTQPAHIRPRPPRPRVSLSRGGTGRTRFAFSAPETFDSETGTVEAVIATDTPVARAYGREILVCEPKAVDLSRIEGGPVMDSHSRSSIKSAIGHVENVRFAAGKIVATLVFDDSPAALAAKKQVASGTIRSVSVGYQVMEMQEGNLRDGDVEVFVTRWVPFEVSLVAVPADPNARIRSFEMEDDMDLEDGLIEREESSRTKRKARRSFTPEERESDFERRLEMLRGDAIDQGLTPANVDDMFEGVRTLDEARRRIFDALAAESARYRTDPYRGDSSGIADRGRGDPQFRDMAVDALAVQLGASRRLNGDNLLANYPVLGIVRRLLDVNGVATRNMDDRQIADFALRGGNWATTGSRGMHTTWDFPSLLMEAGDRALMERFGAERTPLKQLSTKRNARDFRDKGFIRPGEAPKLEKVGEAGEIKRGTLSEEKQGLRLETYAKAFALSRQAIINDDLGGFADFIGAFAASAATTEGDLLYGLLSANSFGGTKLSDGKNLFHADHGNLAASAGAIDVGTLSAARQAMLLQKNVNGTGRAGAVPAVLLVGPKKQTEAETIVASLSPAAVDQVNPFAGKLRVEVETRYEGNGWWLFADPQARPALMHGYLDGNDGPRVETRDGWDILGTEFRCILDFGCGVYDWRAAYFNPGA